MDGYEVCRRLRGTPLLIFTGLNDPKLNSKGFQAGADLAITKTFAAAKLIPIIRTILWLKGKPETGRTKDQGAGCPCVRTFTTGRQSPRRWLGERVQAIGRVPGFSGRLSTRLASTPRR